ncbi:nuclear transport factor 2 family protein [Streptomyces boncukensis]|uniref:Nuclear transport factor 2 family protein n=1 Tax=Streptomyces boncukensis TaxID=2711219 RepID=A0A6G4X7H2_9ACTN|nr:nuclear transport factor 2 family protein [Streptomyces boncukensis]
MSIPAESLSHPAVRDFVAAVNAGDRNAFADVLTPNATMSDDGSERDLYQWAEQEIFSAHGRMDVESEEPGGLVLVARYSNDTWGAMRTAWQFTITDDEKISRFETGQA